MKERKYMYILSEKENEAVTYAINYFFESVPYILDGFMRSEHKEKAEFQALVDTLEALVGRMGDGENE